jgi:hypothetical protein
MTVLMMQDTDRFAGKVHGGAVPGVATSWARFRNA